MAAAGLERDYSAGLAQRTTASYDTHARAWILVCELLGMRRIMRSTSREEVLRAEYQVMMFAEVCSRSLIASSVAG